MRINGYLYHVGEDLTVELESRKQEELSAEEYLAASGVSSEEIRRIIIEAE